MDKNTMASMIDHTILKQEASAEQVKKTCLEAAENHFAAVCVNPCYVRLCAKYLKGTGVKVATVAGFPLGATTTAVKAFETREAIENGAEEVDMVINDGFIKSGDWDAVFEDVKAVVDAADKKAVVKVILENCLLTDDEKVKACEIVKAAGADFVKTSTGFSKAGATAEDVALMRKTVGPDMGVKAAGGIRSTEDALKMIEAGANRLGSSAGIQIIAGLTE